MAGTNIGHGGETDTAENAWTGIARSTGNNQHASRFEVPADYRPGWIMEVAAMAGGYNESVSGRLCMWADDAEGGALIYQGPQQTWNSRLSWRRDFPSAQNAPRIENGKRYWVGFWTDIKRDKQYRVDPDGSEARGRLRLSQVAQSFTGFAYDDGTLAADFHYQQNADPGKPGWVAPYASTGSSGTPPVVNTSQPTFAGNMPHTNGDAQYDKTQLVHVVITREDTNAILYDNTFEPTQAELNTSGHPGGKWSRTLLTLPTGVPIVAKFRHQDSWGVWSVWSNSIRFQCARGPLAPTNLAPSGKINTRTPTYSGIYAHDLALAANAIQIQVMNQSGTQVVYDSGTVAKVVAAGNPWTQPTWHANLNWNTRYTVRARFRSRNEFNTGDVWGPYSDPVPFNTDSEPYKPTNMSPGKNQQSGQSTLTAEVSDPDQDAITQVQIRLYDITAGAYVAGYTDASPHTVAES